VTKAVLVGQGVARFSPGASVDVDIACEIPSSGGQATMFATVHIYAATAQRPVVAPLPNSRLALQRV
jgi:hypothetical protein